MSSHGFSTTRLAAILGMMGSDHDGEVLVAARKAHRMIADAGLDWGRVIATPIGAYAGKPDDPISFNNRMLHPPHEGRWISSALFVLRQGEITRRVTDADRMWVLRRMALWRARTIYPHEAARLITLYEAIMSPEGRL